ncbi:hypothetical protein F5884DRAFT_304549 [Xylogone sp. PMI_703]|nr:hypothetical protein F5884DRAFT_304549 [Xylogone sp. PMI_703]
MVAWIRHDDQTGICRRPKRRIMVSQDLDQVWVTFGEYDRAYLQYLRGAARDGDDQSFLTMHEYGPWDVRDENAMRNLGPLIHAIVMRR